MPKALILSFVLGAALMVGGCANDESPVSPTGGPPIIPDQLVGSWAVQSTTLDGVVTPIQVALHRPARTSTEMMVINGGGDYYAVASDPYGGALYAEHGTLRVNGHDFTRTPKTTDTQPLDLSVQISGEWDASAENLTLTFIDNGRTAVIRYIRSPISNWIYWYY